MLSRRQNYFMTVLSWTHNVGNRHLIITWNVKVDCVYTFTFCEYVSRQGEPPLKLLSGAPIFLYKNIYAWIFVVKYLLALFIIVTMPLHWTTRRIWCADLKGYVSTPTAISQDNLHLHDDEIDLKIFIGLIRTLKDVLCSQRLFWNNNIL